MVWDFILETLTHILLRIAIEFLCVKEMDMSDQHFRYLKVPVIFTLGLEYMLKLFKEV